MENNELDPIEQTPTNLWPITGLIKRRGSILSGVFSWRKSWTLSAVGQGDGGQPVILPSSVRDALRFYPDRFRTHEIIALLDPCYGTLWFYLACKYLSDSPNLLKALLEAYVAYGQSEKDRENYQTFRHIVVSLLDQHISNKAVNGVKAWQLSRLGFSIDDRWIAILDKLRQSWATPVFVLYASALMIDSILAWMQDGDRVYFLDPYDSTDTSQGIIEEGVGERPSKWFVHLTLRDQDFRWRLLRRDDKGQVSVTMVDSDQFLMDLLSDTPMIGLIDDTKNPDNPSFLHIYTRLSRLLGAWTSITTSFAVAWEI